MRGSIWATVLTLSLVTSACGVVQVVEDETDAAPTNETFAHEFENPNPIPALTNPGFEKDIGSEWIRVGGEDYAGAQVSDISHTGNRSAQVRSTSAHSGRSGTGGWAQCLEAESYRGQTVVMTAFLQSEITRGEAYLTLGQGEIPRERIASDGDEVSGVRDWTQRSTKLAVSGSAERICLTIVLNGLGSVWIDDVGFAAS